MNPETGEVTGLEPQAPRAVRRGYKPPQPYGQLGENGVRGSQAVGENVGTPKHLADGSWTSPTVAHFEAIDSVDAVRGLDASPWEQHLIDVNNVAWEPDLRWWAVAGAAQSIAAKASGAPSSAGGEISGDRGGVVPAVDGIGSSGGSDDGFK